MEHLEGLESFKEVEGFFDCVTKAVDQLGLNEAREIADVPMYAFKRWYKKENRPASFIQRDVIKSLSPFLK